MGPGCWRRGRLEGRQANRALWAGRLGARSAAGFMGACRWTRLQAPRPDRRPAEGIAGARRGGPAWRRLPVAAEVATIGTGYAAYSLVRLAIRASRHAALAHAAQLWTAERWLHMDAEPYLNHLAAAHAAVSELTGYYYGLLHFLATPLALAWLYLSRPAAFPRLRSALVITSTARTPTRSGTLAQPPSLPGKVPGHDSQRAASANALTSARSACRRSCVAYLGRRETTARR